jgi:hypothetical protein
MKYIIVNCDHYGDLEKRVNEKLEQGYELVGGVSAILASVHRRDLEFYQAMVKTENK